MRLEVRVLGRFSVRVDGVSLELGARKAQALVALLALEGSCSREWLSECLWGEFGEVGARKNLRKTLHRLRETPLEGALEVRGEALVLHAEAVDALEFLRLASAGEFVAALEIGGGTLLEGLDLAAEGWTAWLETRRADLTARRREALLGLAGQHEARGELRGALEAIEQALSLDEFDERATREAMRLLLNLGDREAAIGRFERFRALAASVGLEPEAATLALAGRVRTSAGEAEREAPKDSLQAPLVGREAAWLRLGASEARLRVILGEPGVGKTRLALELAHAHDRCFVAHGRAEAVRTPFYPVAQLLRDALEAGRWSPETLEPVWRLEAARLVPECAPETLSPPSTEDGRARFLEGLSRAVLGLLQGADQGEGGTLLFDDLHWFDEGSLELVAHLVRRARGARFIATARLIELEAFEPSRRALDGLRRDGLVETLALDPLTEADVLALVQGLSGGGGGALFARRLHSVTRGNPLYLLELLRGLLEAGTLERLPGGGWATPFDDSTEDYAELPIRPSLRETVLERVARLGPLTRRLLETASLLGAPFSASWLSGVIPDEFERLEALEAAARAGLLENEAAGLGFRHELLRRALAESLSDERRRALHRHLAEQLEAASADPERIAFHLERAGQAEAAVPYLERVARSAEAVYAYREALAPLERALEHVTDDGRRWGLEVWRVRLLRQLTDLDAYQEGLDRLERLAETSKDSQRRAEAYLQRGMFHLWRGQTLEAAAQAGRALGLPDLSRPLEAEAHYLVGHAQVRLGRIGLGLEHLSRAQACAAGDEALSPELEGSIENGLAGAHLYLGEYGRALEHNARADAAWSRVGEALAIFTAGGRGALEIHLGRFEAARATLEDAIRRSLEHGHPSAASFAYRYRALLELQLGRAHEAEADITRSLELCQGKNLRLEAQLVGLGAGRLWFAGQLPDALKAAREALERGLGLRFAPLIAESRLILAGFLADLGAFAAARAELEATRRLADELGDASLLRPYLARLETITARIELALGRHERAVERLSATPRLENATFTDRAAHAIELARAMTGAGQAREALERVAALEPPPPLVPLALGVTLEARARLGLGLDDLTERALALGESDRAAPTDRLELITALAGAMTRAGRDSGAVQALARATLESLMASLKTQPELSAGLLRRFGHLLGGSFHAAR